MSFQTATSPRSAKKNRQVCPHQSLAKIACDFRWRSNSPRSAKIARCVWCRDCDFRRSPRSAYKIADIWRVRYRRLNSPAFAKCVRSRDFLRSLLQIASKTSPSGWVVLSHDFWTPPSAKKIAKCVRFNRWRKSLMIFAGDQICRDRRIKSPGVSLPFSVSVPAIFYGHCCESPVKLTHRWDRAILSHDFSKLPQCRGRRKKSSSEQIADDFRWRSNSPQSAYTIARCVAGFKQQRGRE